MVILQSVAPGTNEQQCVSVNVRMLGSAFGRRTKHLNGRILYRRLNQETVRGEFDMVLRAAYLRDSLLKLGTKDRASNISAVVLHLIVDGNARLESSQAGKR